MDIQRIIVAVESTGSVNGAAALLGISPALVKRNLLEHGLTVVKEARVVSMTYSLTEKGRAALAAAGGGQ